MLQFSEEYFKTEKRDGFVINELMKKAWSAQLEVLSKVIAVCDKYNLTYYAYWGTLIGTVRHQGYIPWDDDLDIAMKKDDYIKFLEVAQHEFPEEYRILNCYTESGYEDSFSRIINGGYIDLSEKRMREYHGCPFAVGIDIFPLYYIPRDCNNARIQKNILTAIIEISTLVRSTSSKSEADRAVLLEGLTELSLATGYEFTDDRPLHNHLKILYDQISRLFEEEESDTLTVFPLYMKYGYQVEKELLSESILMPFENMMLNVPKGYDAILRKSYGDYMVPRKVKAGHDYPFYKGQLQTLAQYMEEQAGGGQAVRISRNLPELGIDEKTGVEVPKDWLEKIYAGGKRKKIVLYHTTAEDLMCQETYVENKLRYVFDLFRENEEVVLWWLPGLVAKSDLSYMQQITPRLVADYPPITEEFLKDNFGIYDDTGDVKRAIMMADAYYGDDCEVLELFKTTGKAAMIQDYEIAE